MIRFAKKNDFDRIVELWKQSFEDDDFANWYFCNIYKEENTLVYEINDYIVAMLARIPYKIKDLGDVTYIYGACTDNKYRKQGIMTKLLKYSEELDINLGKSAVILIPENESLFSFYEKCGFSDYFYKYYMNKNGDLEVDDGLLISNNNNINRYFEDVKIENVTEMKPNFYKILYNITDLYKTININNMEVIRDIQYYERLIDMYNKNGGKVYVAYNCNSELIGYVFGYEDEVFKVTELIYKNLEYRSYFINKLKELYQDYIILNEPQGDTKKKYGYIKFLEKHKNINKIIINLMYD